MTARLEDKMDSHHEELMAIMKAGQEQIEAMMKACLVKTKATDLEAYPEETKSKLENQEVPKEGPRWKLSEHWRTDMGTGI
jgi:hypothetical protein